VGGGGGFGVENGGGIEGRGWGGGAKGGIGEVGGVAFRYSREWKAERTGYKDTMHWS